MPPGANLSVQVSWWDDTGLHMGMRRLTFNGEVVTSLFTHIGSGASSTSTGTLTRVTGTNTLVAYICDTSNNCTTQTQNWTYTSSTVVVTPVVPERVVAPNAGATQAFTVKNTGSASATYALTGSCSGSASGCVASPSTLTLAGGASSTVNVSFTAGAGGGSGLIQLQARQTTNGAMQDGGSAHFTIRPIAMDVCYQAHVGYIGWMNETCGGQVTGVPGEQKDVQAMTLRLVNGAGARICYQAHVAHVGWQAEVCDGAYAGTTGQSLDMQAIRIRLVSPAAGERVCYQAYVRGVGWQSEVCDNQQAGTTGQSLPIEGLKVRILPGLSSAQVAPVVDVASVNPGGTAARGLCLTVALPGAAAQCGDLVITHALPSTRTYNKERTPVLIYNSQTASPAPLVAANITLSSTVRPDQVEAILRVNGVERNRATWTGSGWSAGSTRRIVLGYDARNDATGIYPYTLEVTHWYGTTPRSTIVSGELVVVNRAGSPYGAGWWVGGLESLNPATKVWVGGDGSLRRYVATGVANRWVATPALDRPDTLKYDGTHYIRTLPGGVQVLFDAMGRHVETVNRLGHRTRFTYDASGALQMITLPVPNAAPARTYQFGYVSGRLGTVTAPALGDTARVVTVSNPSGRVAQIRDPDSTLVRFGYASAVAVNWITDRYDRRNTRAQYTYRSTGKLERGRQYLQKTPAEDIIQTLTTAEDRGVAPTSVDTALVFTSINGPRTDVVDVTQVWIDRYGAPRKIRDAVGNETTILRSAAFPALATRTQAPNGLVQEAFYNARGNVEVARTLDPLGDGRNAVTRYVYGDAAWPDFATQVTDPEGRVSRMTYVAPGLSGQGSLWQQEDGRGAESRVTFSYGNVHGLVSSTILPGGARDSLEYSSSQANLTRSRTPKGYWASYENDAVGRTWKVTSPISSGYNQVSETKFYRKSDRVERTTTTAAHQPGVDNTPQTLTTQHTYDEEGNVKSVARRSDPDPNGIGWITTRWDYDAAGRTVAEWAPDNQVDSTYYDPAGNVIKVRTRRHSRFADTTRMEYDALNRLTSRRTAAVSYASRTGGIASGNFAASSAENVPYPRYPNDGGTGYRIAADTARFTYDPGTGGLQQANNRDARITREYYPNGQLRSETQSLRNTEGNTFGGHVYVLEHRYDLSGRRTELKHPTQLAPSATQNTTRYRYHAGTGALEVVTDALGNTFRYAYRPDGAVEKVTLPSGVTESFAYDLDGNQTSHQVWNPVLNYFQRVTTFTHDMRGKILTSRSQHGAQDTLDAYYSGLGHLVAGGISSRTQEGDRGTCQSEYKRSKTGETFGYDALGNQHRTATADTVRYRCAYTQGFARDRRFAYQAGTGRLMQTTHSDQRDTTYYDASGNAEFVTQSWWRQLFAGAKLQDRAAYYGADGKLYAADTRSVPRPEVDNGRQFSAAFEEYRYDALGRRVWVRARRHCEDIGYASECMLDKVRRTVWDGEQELYEIQMPGQTGSTYLENDAGVVGPLPRDNSGGTGSIDPNPFFGRVAYTHGLGLDRPLSVIRMGYSDVIDDQGLPATARTVGAFAIVPLWNSRGQADLGVFADGQVRKCVTLEGKQRCVWDSWPGQWLAYDRPRLRRMWWYGSLLEDKEDASGQFYRRNRYYDATTGRFTQEDPIGLAGGLNLYGYANGDPVNFSDPFGLDCMDANGKRIPCSPLPMPLQLARLVNRTTLQVLQPESTRGSGFVMRTRSDGRPYQHQGLDLRAAPGIEVYALYDGIVTQAVAADDGNSAGLRVTIRSANAVGETTSYWHLSSVYVQQGDVVTGGQPIGTTGTSGNADPGNSGREAHLHLRKQVNGRDVDPGVHP